MTTPCELARLKEVLCYDGLEDDILTIEAACDIKYVSAKGALKRLKMSLKRLNQYLEDNHDSGK